MSAKHLWIWLEANASEVERKLWERFIESKQSVGGDVRFMIAADDADLQFKRRTLEKAGWHYRNQGEGWMQRVHYLTKAQKMTRRLYDLAYGRSGDKGDIANISVIARSPEAYQDIKARLTAERVKRHLGDLVRGEVVRYELDNIEALNFVCHKALDGGGTRSLRIDALGKSLAGALLYMEWDEN